MRRDCLGDIHKALAGVDLSLSNVLIPECTDGQLYDALYCDTTLSEEDLPAFLSLLRPQGRMTVVIEEELLLITRRCVRVLPPSKPQTITHFMCN